MNNVSQDQMKEFIHFILSGDNMTDFVNDMISNDIIKREDVHYTSEYDQTNVKQWINLGRDTEIVSKLDSCEISYICFLENVWIGLTTVEYTQLYNNNNWKQLYLEMEYHNESDNETEEFDNE